MKNILLFFCLITTSALMAQTPAPNKLVSFGQPDSLYSSILKENRPLWIFSPPLDTPYFSAAQYPVLFIMDGDAYFPYLVSLMQQLAFVNGNTALPKMIIVGIPNTGNNRTRDLTPTTDTAFPGSGGGAQFTAFLEKELIPYINKKYPAAPYRVIIGHSLGGLMATDMMLHRPHLFNAYLASDPSLFFNSKAIMKDPHLKNAAGKKYYMAIAHTMREGLDTSDVRKDTEASSTHINTILSFMDLLKSRAPGSLAWKAKYYDDDDHGSLPSIALYDGLRFFFKNFRFPTYLYRDASCPADSLKQLITDHFDLLSKDLGYDVKPEEAWFNGLGYMHLQQKHYEQAKLFFGLNVHYFPGRSNPYDSMGDYYQAINDSAHAIEYYKKALSIYFSTDTNDKLKKLQGR